MSIKRIYFLNNAVIVLTPMNELKANYIIINFETLSAHILYRSQRVLLRTNWLTEYRSQLLLYLTTTEVMVTKSDLPCNLLSRHVNLTSHPQLQIIDDDSKQQLFSGCTSYCTIIHKLRVHLCSYKIPLDTKCTSQLFQL